MYIYIDIPILDGSQFSRLMLQLSAICCMLRLNSSGLISLISIVHPSLLRRSDLLVAAPKLCAMIDICCSYLFVLTCTCWLYVCTKLVDTPQVPPQMVFFASQHQAVEISPVNGL